MKILLDEQLDPGLAAHALPHDVVTARQMDWAGADNGDLLSLAALTGFEAMVTIDKRMPHQQNPEKTPLPVIVLDALANDEEDVLRRFQEAVATLESGLPPGFHWTDGPRGQGPSGSDPELPPPQCRP